MGREEEILELIEFETKYEVDESLLNPFKELVEKQIGYKKFIYVQGPDVFFTKPGEGDLIFARYRKAEHGDTKAQFTVKQQHNENNNIKRTETNWDVTRTPYEEIEKGAEIIGFRRNTSIWKSCHIYNLDDANLVFYTVRDEDSNYTHFIEIEVKEGMKITEDQAWEIIKKYEDLLKPLGINAQRRKRLSLFQMYKKETQ